MPAESLFDRQVSRRTINLGLAAGVAIATGTGLGIFYPSAALAEGTASRPVSKARPVPELPTDIVEDEELEHTYRTRIIYPVPLTDPTFKSLGYRLRVTQRLIKDEDQPVFQKLLVMNSASPTTPIRLNIVFFNGPIHSSILSDYQNFQVPILRGKLIERERSVDPVTQQYIDQEGAAYNQQKGQIAKESSSYSELNKRMAELNAQPQFRTYLQYVNNQQAVVGLGAELGLFIPWDSDMSLVTLPDGTTEPLTMRENYILLPLPMKPGSSFVDAYTQSRCLPLSPDQSYPTPDLYDFNDNNDTYPIQGNIRNSTSEVLAHELLHGAGIDDPLHYSPHPIPDRLRFRHIKKANDLVTNKGDYSGYNIIEEASNIDGSKYVVVT